ncbi:MAG TPA: BON domain-containing protein [Burkholderiales bacterium]|nr:BON domain-containing protein [Burkholderiales bacterium]
MSPLLVGAALGATGAFILDPQQGRRRRALVRDKVVSGLNDGRRFADAARKDLRWRAQGIAARARSRRGEPVTDDVLSARVHSKIGRYSSHPGAIEVTALDGRVVLTGDVLQRELERLVDATRGVPGVQHVDNQLRVHETADHVSALQGTGTGPYGEPWEVFEETWTPGVRALVGGAGAASLLYALARGGFGALVPLAIGAALFACAVKASPRSG